jgi:cell cycle sensor histidine kinase DivJ
MAWLDDWLDGALGAAAAADPPARALQERFLVARLVCAAAALAAVPLFLALGVAPQNLDGLALAALAAPLAAFALLVRTGRIDAAQAVVSTALALLAAGIAFRVGPGPIGYAAFALVPLEALFAGSRRGLAVATGLAALGLCAALIGTVAGEVAVPRLMSLAPVALAYAVGHGVAALVHEHRLRRLFAEATRAGEAREGAALQAIDDLVTWHDRSGGVTRASGAALKLFAANPASLAGRGLFDRLVVSDRPAFLKAISNAATADGPVVATLRASADGPGRADRKTLVLEMRVHRLSGRGEDARLIAVSRDVSGHVAAAEESEARRRAAEEKAAAQTKLLATVSAELQKPLETIVGYADLLASGRGSGREYPALIRQSGRHLHGVVAGLLDLAAIEAGDAELEPEVLAVADLVEDGCAGISAAAAQADVALIRDVHGGLPDLVADRRACRRILGALLSNAVAFTPRGGVVAVAARREGGRLALSVRDSGRGVAPRDLSRLGEPFFRAGPAGPGRGLGLSLVRGLVAIQGGRLTLASTPGDGFCATVSLLIPTAPLPRREAVVHPFAHPATKPAPRLTSTG